MNVTPNQRTGLAIASLWVLVVIVASLLTHHTFVLAFAGLAAVLLFPFRRQ